MKIRFSSFFILVMFVLAMTACQGNQNAPGETLVPGGDEGVQNENGSGYPAGDSGEESYPVQEFIPFFEGNDAYPISEDDLQLILRTWSRATYSEDGLLQDPGVKTLRFNSDGSYEIVTESGTSTGNWTAGLTAMESTLILDPDTDEMLTFEIVNLQEALLNLRSIREGITIEEEFLPAE